MVEYFEHMFEPHLISMKRHSRFSTIFTFLIALLLTVSSCSFRNNISNNSVLSADDRKTSSNSSELFTPANGSSMKIPFERPYKGPYRLPNNRIAYTQDTLEEYPFLKEAGIKPGIYPLDSTGDGSKSSSAIDISNYGFISPSIGTVRVLVLKVEFDGQGALPGWSNSEINRALFQPNSDKPGGSLRDYFFRQSQGQLNLIGDIYPQDNTYYHLPGSPTLPLTVTAATNLLNQADADGINFLDYDADNSGKIDALLILYKVNFREFVGPFWNDFGNAAQQDGVQIFRASFLAHEVIEDYNHFVIFHEFGHILGLPDLYDYGSDALPPDPGPDGDESNGNGFWEMMAAGNYTWPPQNLSAVSKYILGWEEPINLTSNVKNLRVYPVESGRNRIYRVWKNGEIGPEYFLIENRSTSGQWLYKSPGVYPSALYLNFFSSGIELRNLPAGLIIWHVEENVFNEVGNFGFGCNDYEERKFIDMEESSASYSFSYGGRSIIDHDEYYGGTYDPWPQTINSTNYNSFTSTTIPNSNSYSGEPTIAITNIRRDGADILIDVSIGAPDIEFDLPKAVFSGYISLEPTLAANVSEIEYTFNGSPVVTVTESPFTFEYDVSSLPFGSYEFRALARGSATDDTDEVILHIIVDNTTGTFPLMETFDRGNYQVAGTGFTTASPFRVQTGGYDGSPISYGVYNAAEGGYLPDTTGLLVLPLIDLTNVTNPTLVFRQHFNLEQSKDFVEVRVSTDDFATLGDIPRTRGGSAAVFTGYWDTWRTSEVNLNQWANQKVRIGFRFVSDSAVAGEQAGSPAGWWIDNIVVAADYADSVPYIINTGLRANDLFGFVPEKPELNIVPQVANNPESIVYRLITVEGTIQGEITGSPLNLVLDLTSYKNQRADLVLQPKAQNGFLGPAVSTPILLYNLRGDTNGDGSVNEMDISPLLTFYGLDSSNQSYLPWIDANGDSIIDERDLTVIGYFFGQTN